MRLEHIKIQGYRALHDVDLRLGKLNVLIGPNGCGKSTFLDVLALLSEATGEGLSKGIVARGGIDRMLSRGVADSLEIGLTTSPIERDAAYDLPLGYRVALSRGGTGYAIHDEMLYWPVPDAPHSAEPIFAPGIGSSFGAVDHPDWLNEHASRSELALAQVPRELTEARILRRLLATTRHYAPILLDARSDLRNNQLLQPNVAFPSPTGEDLLSALYRMRMENEANYAQLMDMLAVGFPGFQKLEFPIVAGGHVALEWRDDSVKGPLYGQELSAGTLRFLHLAAMLLAPELPPLLILDEPEMSFHPELLRLLAELLLDASERTQIIVATHSAPLLKWLKPEHIVAVDRTESGSVFTRGDDLDLAHWLETYSLDQLWQMNVFGAQP